MNLDNYTKVEHEDGRIELIPKAKGVEYWHVHGDGTVDNFDDDGHAFDKDSLEFHNYYPSEAQAQKAAEYMRRSNAIIRACLLVDPDFEPDWDDNNQKWGCELYDHFDQCWAVAASLHTQLAPAYVSTREKAKQVRDLLIKWGVK